MILYRHDIRHRNFILTGGIGADHKTATKKMFKYLLQKTQKVICREKTSYERCQKYKTKSALLYQDFSKDILSPGVVANL
jgi:polysaccharide pyruvyl transferase WcaK-like protein